MRLKKVLIAGVVAVTLLSGLWLWISTSSFYAWTMRKTVDGEVVSIASLMPQTVIGTNSRHTTYSFALAIKAKDGTIYSASAEDRQWAIVKEGYRVRATLFPYGPLQWKKQGTYHGARLVQILSAPSSGAQSGDQR